MGNPAQRQGGRRAGPQASGVGGAGDRRSDYRNGPFSPELAFMPSKGLS